MKIESLTQKSCEHHECIEATQTTTSGNNFTFNQCKKCGTILSKDKRLSDFTKMQLEKYKYNSNLKIK